MIEGEVMETGLGPVIEYGRERMSMKEKIALLRVER